jgi:hypothetical protein
VNKIVPRKGHVEFFVEGMLQLITNKQQRLLLLRKTSSTQTSSQILLRNPGKRKLLKA